MRTVYVGARGMNEIKPAEETPHLDTLVSSPRLQNGTQVGWP